MTMIDRAYLEQVKKEAEELERKVQDLAIKYQAGQHAFSREYDLGKRLFHASYVLTNLCVRIEDELLREGGNG